MPLLCNVAIGLWMVVMSQVTYVLDDMSQILNVMSQNAWTLVTNLFQVFFHALNINR